MFESPITLKKNNFCILPQKTIVFLFGQVVLCYTMKFVVVVFDPCLLHVRGSVNNQHIVWVRQVTNS